MTDRKLSPSGDPWRNRYGRSHGKTLRLRQKQFLEQDLQALSPGLVDREVNPDRSPLDLHQRFDGKPIWLEIGFGGGEHLVHQAAANPQIAIIGCEPFINGVAMLLGKIREAGVKNLAIYPGDVRDLFDVLPMTCIERAFLLYPDPWPKQRHHRRRFVTESYLAPLAKVLKPGAMLRLATDIPDYVRQTLKQIPGYGFELTPETGEDFQTPWADWISTRYEKKAYREGRVPQYLTFQRMG
ncbi:MAG: tRNA (guanosine(46)-N7)-methyltransferase TrmB [Paracoccaceae bacterium]